MQDMYLYLREDRVIQFRKIKKLLHLKSQSQIVTINNAFNLGNGCRRTSLATRAISYPLHDEVQGAAPQWDYRGNESWSFAFVQFIRRSFALLL